MGVDVETRNKFQVDAGWYVYTYGKISVLLEYKAKASQCDGIAIIGWRIVDLR
jgi:hypothetical protein